MSLHSFLNGNHLQNYTVTTKNITASLRGTLNTDTASKCMITRNYNCLSMLYTKIETEGAPGTY